MKANKTIKFTKMSGAGNDFIVIQDRSLVLKSELVKRLCDRHNGIGADGILEISESHLAPFKLRYFNADGSEGFLCLNGSRCAVMYAFQKKLTETPNVEFEYLDQIFKALVLDESKVKVNVSEPKKILYDLQVKFHSQKINAHYVDLGSEHLIIFVNENPVLFNEYKVPLSELDVRAIGKEIRWLPDFAPNGVNVNFVNIKSKNELEIRTYERGVENETLACGSGSVSTALILSMKYSVNPPITLTTFGGDKLVVDFDVEGDNFQNVSITGPAKITFEGDIVINY